MQRLLAHVQERRRYCTPTKIIVSCGIVADVVFMLGGLHMAAMLVSLVTSLIWIWE